MLDKMDGMASTKHGDFHLSSHTDKGILGKAAASSDQHDPSKNSKDPFKNSMLDKTGGMSADKFTFFSSKDGKNKNEVDMAEFDNNEKVQHESLSLPYLFHRPCLSS